MSLFVKIMFGLMFIFGCVSIIGIGLLCDTPLFVGVTPEKEAYTLMIFGGLGMFAACGAIAIHFDDKEFSL